MRVITNEEYKKEISNEAFVEQEHPRDSDGKFSNKDGSNSRVERQKSILQQEIDYLKKSIKEESKKYRPFEKVSDEDRSIRGKNRNVLENIKELEEELNSSDTVGLPHIPLKPNTHEIETIDNGMYLSNSDSEPEYESDRELMKTWSGMKLGLHSLEGFKKGNSTIKVSIDIKEKGSYGISRETSEKQINLAKIMWNSLSDEERDSINNFTIEQKPSVKMVKNEKGEDVIDGESLHDSSILGYWQPSTNELAIRIDSSYKSQEIKGTFIHEVAHSMYHKLKDKHPERIKEWKKSVEKIPPTTKYGKYNLKRWKNGEKQFKELEANNWEWQEVVAKDSDGNVIRTGKWNDEIKMEKELIPKEDVEKLKSTALSNIEFYKDLYFNEIHSEVHMYMMGQQKRGHMKKTGKVTKGISKFIDPYRLLHDLPKMEEPLVVGEVEEDSPVMEVVDITESISEVVIYLDENFERVLTEDEGEYEFIIELNDDMTIKKYTIKSMWEKVEEAFVEQEHPRAKDGKFAKKGTVSSGKSDLENKLDSYIKDLEKKIEKQKESPSIQKILEKGGKPNEMDLKIAKLNDKMEKEGDVETDRTFEHTWSDGETTEITGTAKYEKLWNEYIELTDKQAKEEEEAYKEFYGWKEGDPIRWTPHNDDPDAGDTSGDYGPDYTYKHMTDDESDSIMREQWNDMTRNEREDRYRYFFSKNIPYVNEDGDTPEDLREDLGEDQSIPSKYFFFTDKKTRKQFRGFGMTEAEIKKRAEHGIGSYHEDNRLVGRPDRDVVVYDRPLDYAKFNSKHINSKNFYNERNSNDEIKQSRKIDKLWDDMTGDERDTILSDEQNYGDFFSDWRSDQEKLFYEWKQKNDGFVNETVHDNLYSEYPDKSSATQSLEWTDEDYLKVGKKAWSKGSDKKLIELAKEYEQYGIMDDLKREIINKYQPKQYYQLSVEERDSVIADYFDSMNEYDKEDIINNISDGRLDSSYTFSDLSEYEQESVVMYIEGDVDEEPRYDISEYFAKKQPKLAIGFDYERGIPEPQGIDVIQAWSNRMNRYVTHSGQRDNSKNVIIPTYPKVEQRNVEEHEKILEKSTSKLKEEVMLNLPKEEEYHWQLKILDKEKQDFIEYVEKNKSKLNIPNLDIHKRYRIRNHKDSGGDDWWDYPDEGDEKGWREDYLRHALDPAGKKVSGKVTQLRLFSDLLEHNPELREKYQPLLDRTEELNHENFDLFLKTPEFYRGTNTEELDHYIENNDLGKQWDWREKSYPFTSLSLDKRSAISPSEQRINWEKGDDGVLSGGKVSITYEGDSVRQQALPVQYNLQGGLNMFGSDASEIIGMPYNMVAYDEREVRMNPNDSIPKIKEINFGVNYGKYKDKKIISKAHRKKLVDKYKSLVGGDVSKIKFYKFVEANESYIAQEFVEDEHPRDEDGKFADKDGGSSGKTYESGEKVDEYKKKIKEEITPTKEENEKNSQVEKSVIDGIKERIKGTNYEDKIKFIETQGSFAKGTDLAGSSDLDIFVGFDYDIDIKEIEEVILELGDDVLKPISDEGEYKIMNGAGKKYPESYVNGVEVQIIGTSDITLEQIKKGFEEGGMKTATDRSPHHTRFMKKALKGKEQEVRTLKKFFKNAGVYDASIAKQGFSGFSTEVLIHNLGSFDKVLEFFANFEKGSVVGETSRKFDTPLVMVDPIDENRNLASAFSHSDKEGSIIPNKNLARLIKSAQSIIETGELPEITKEKEDSISIDLEVPENLDKNEVYSQAYSSAMDLQTVFKMNGYGVMVPIDKITDDFEVKVPRINVEYDGKKNVKINFGLKNFENEYEYKSKMKNDRPKEQIDAFMERNDDVVEIDGTYYARVKRVFNTAEKFLHGVVDGKVKNVGLGVVGRLENNEWVNKWKTKNISRGEKEYENITGKIKSTESYVVITEAEFKEEEHPREDNGKFAKKGSGSSSQKTELQKLDDGIGTTKDFINQWSGWSRTALYDNLINKGGLSSATWKTNTKVRVGDRLSVGINNKDAYKDWKNAEKMFLQALEDNPKFKKVFKEYEKGVKQQNKALQKRYGEEKTFYRGGTVDELEAIFGKYEDEYYNPEWRSRYNFKSLSMNYEDTLKMYNGGMMIHFNGDSVRESQSKLVNYNPKPTKYLHANVDSSINQEEIENIDTDNPSFLMDEEEVRVKNNDMNNVKIDKIEIFMGSAGFGHTSNLLHEKFGIDYYGDKRNEFDGLVDHMYYVGKWDENGGKYFNVVDGKIVDKKTNKEYEKTKEGLKEIVNEMKLEMQNALMKNKKFREKVKEVVIK